MAGRESRLPDQRQTVLLTVLSTTARAHSRTPRPCTPARARAPDEGSGGPEGVAPPAAAALGGRGEDVGDEGDEDQEERLILLYLIIIIIML